MRCAATASACHPDGERYGGALVGRAAAALAALAPNQRRQSAKNGRGGKLRQRGQRHIARQCRLLSMYELIRLTHHHEQGRALRAIDVLRGRLVITKLRHGCTGDGAHVRVVAHERRAGLTNVRVGHVGTGKDSRVQAGEHVLSAATFLPSAAGTSN